MSKNILNLDKKELILTIEGKQLKIREFSNAKRRAYISKINETTTGIGEIFKSLYAQTVLTETDNEKLLELAQKIQEKVEEQEVKSAEYDKEIFELILDEQFDNDWFLSLSYPQCKQILIEVNKLNDVVFDPKKGVTILPVVMELLTQ